MHYKLFLAVNKLQKEKVPGNLLLLPQTVVFHMSTIVVYAIIASSDFCSTRSGLMDNTLGVLPYACFLTLDTLRVMLA